jgi:hypothetical protein
MAKICNFAKNGDFSHFGEKCDFSWNFDDHWSSSWWNHKTFLKTCLIFFRSWCWSSKKFFVAAEKIFVSHDHHRWRSRDNKKNSLVKKSAASIKKNLSARKKKIFLRKYFSTDFIFSFRLASFPGKKKFDWDLQLLMKVAKKVVTTMLSLRATFVLWSPILALQGSDRCSFKVRGTMQRYPDIGWATIPNGRISPIPFLPGMAWVTQAEGILRSDPGRRTDEDHVRMRWSARQPCGDHLASRRRRTPHTRNSVESLHCLQSQLQPGAEVLMQTAQTRYRKNKIDKEQNSNENRK